MLAAIAGIAGAVGLEGGAGRAIARSPVTTHTKHAPQPAPKGIHKIQHVVIIMQENRSFDSYFGTYPGADGLPRNKAGQFTTCMPDPQHHDCVRPYHDPRLVNIGGPHEQGAFLQDLNGGQMNGFIKSRETCRNPDGPDLVSAIGAGFDVMGYHTAHELPNYWKYAKNYVLQDHMFEPVDSWSLPAHLYMVSEWSAVCSVKNDPMSCKTQTEAPNFPQDLGPAPHKAPNYAWTDLTSLLHRHHVSWAYYIAAGPRARLRERAGASASSVIRTRVRPGSGIRCRRSPRCRQDHQLSNIKATKDFYAAAKGGQLPAVSWVIPNGIDSEHPTSNIATGEKYVTSVINAIMRSKDWASTAIFLAWDDWGGFYDHVKPPVVDGQGYGLPGSRAGHQSVRAQRLHRPPASSASTRTTSSSKLTSSVASRSTPRPMVARIRDRTSGSGRRVSATCSRTSTSPSGRAARWCWRRAVAKR